MREHKKKDIARNATKKVYKDRIDKITFISHSTFVEEEIEVNNPMIIVGRNGVGKTRLLKLIESIFLSLIDYDYDYRDRFEICVSGFINGSGFTTIVYRHHQDKVRFNGSSELKAIYLNPSREASLSVSWLLAQDDLFDLLDQYTPYQFTPNDLELISMFAGKNYERIEAFIFDDIPESHPYFIVRDDTKTYDSLSMGNGEMCLLLIFYYMRTSLRGSIIILDEPENSIMYSSQVVFPTLMYYFMISNDNFFIISTHSPGIVNSISRANVHLLYEISGKVSILKSPPDRLIQEITGIPASKRLKLLVEDGFAKMLLSSLIWIADFELYGHLDIIVGGSESNLDMIRRSTLLERINDIYIVFDGDCRAKYGEGRNILYLLGDMAPEIVVLSFIRKNLWQFSKISTIDLTTMQIAFEECKTIDHHDQIAYISKRNNVNEGDLAKKMCDYYALNHKEAVLKDLVVELESTLKPID